MQVFAPGRPYKTGGALLKAGGSEGVARRPMSAPSAGRRGVKVCRNRKKYVVFLLIFGVVGCLEIITDRRPTNFAKKNHDFSLVSRRQQCCRALRARLAQRVNLKRTISKFEGNASRFRRVSLVFVSTREFHEHKGNSFWKLHKDCPLLTQRRRQSCVRPLHKAYRQSLVWRGGGDAC